MSSNLHSPEPNQPIQPKVRVAGVESPELPEYLRISHTKKYARQPSPPKNPRKIHAELHYGVSAATPENFHLKDAIVIYNKTPYDPYLDFGVRSPQEKSREYTKQERPGLVTLVNNFQINHLNQPVPESLPKQTMRRFNCITGQASIVEKPQDIKQFPSKYRSAYQERANLPKGFHLKHGYFTDFSRQMRNTEIFNEKSNKSHDKSNKSNKSFDQTSRRTPLTDASFEKTNTRPTSASRVKWSTENDKPDNHKPQKRYQTPEFNRRLNSEEKEKAGKTSRSRSMDKRERDTHVSFNVSYDPQAQKQEIERILNQDKSFLNSMNMTLEKSFLDEHEPPTHTRLEKHPKYKKIIEARAGKYREKTTYEAIENFEAQLEKIKRTHPLLKANNREVYKLDERIKLERVPLPKMLIE